MTVQVESSYEEVFEAILSSPQVQDLSYDEIVENLHPSPSDYNSAVDTVNELKAFAKSREGGEYLMVTFANMLIRAHFKSYINKRQIDEQGGVVSLKVVK